MASSLLLALACAAPEPQSPASPLAAGVRILPRDRMLEWCQATGDPDGACEDFRTPPADVVARFDAELAERFAAEGHADLGRRVRTYLRQYWAVWRAGRLEIVGNFTCRSVLESRIDVDYDTGEDIPPDPEAEWIPVVVDDVGICNVMVGFPADAPEDVRVTR